MAVKIAIILLSVAVIIQTLMIDRLAKRLDRVDRDIFRLRRRTLFQYNSFSKVAEKIEDIEEQINNK